MATTYQTTDSIIAGSTWTATADGDVYHVLEGVFVASTGSSSSPVDTDGFDDLQIYIAGTLSSNDFGVDGFNGSAGVSLTIAETGSIISHEESSGHTSIAFNGGGSVVANFGSIISNETIGVYFSGPNNEITNMGTISGTLGIQLTGSSYVVNGGYVSGSGNFDGSQDPYEGHGIYIQTGASVVHNLEGGVITTSFDDGYAINITTSSTSTINNAGDLVSASTAIFNGGSGAVNIANSGLIQGAIALEGSSGIETIGNSGVIVGDIILNSGADTYTGTSDGRVDGEVYGGAGTDTLKGSDAADVFYGGDDLDTLKGGGGNDELHGEGTGDMIFGGDGNDLAFGGSGSDIMHGGDGADELQGGAKNDTLKGQNGNDVLMGNSGDDEVYGGSGEDILIGGAGVDGMNGGAGADIFVFEATTDTGTGSDRDSIRGFNTDEDILDFSEIDFDLIYIGTDTFNGTGDTEVRLKEKSNGNTNVSIDIDGNGTTDMEIILFNTLGLSADNFLL